MIEGQQGVTWQHWLALAEAAERLGFEGLFTSDHYFSSTGPGGRGSNDAWTILGALAARTERLRLGALVSPVTFRHPAVLAKAAVTVDRISSGRVEIGMGAGWWTEEHAQHGFPFPGTRERFDRLEEQLEIVHGLLTEERYSFRGTHYSLDDCEFLPKGMQRPHPPIIVGGQTVGSWAQRMIGRWADEFNTVRASPAETARRFGRARAGIEAAGRDQASLTTSLMTWFYIGRTDGRWRAAVRRSIELDPSLGDLDAYVESLEDGCLVGTPQRVVDRIGEYADAGVQRIFLNHDLYDDVEMLELLAAEVFPQVPR